MDIAAEESLIAIATCINLNFKDFNQIKSNLIAFRCFLHLI